jgi:hypothetical protein
MPLTAPQLATLKAAIEADPILVAKPLNSDGYYETAAILNTELASPDFYVWRTLVTQDEIMQNGFDWVRVDNLSVGKSRIWEWMFDNAATAINPSKANVRAGIAEVWKGTAADNAVRFAVFEHCQTRATRAQKLFATGTGATTDQDGVGPATMAVEAITMSDVEAARALP